MKKEELQGTKTKKERKEKESKKKLTKYEVDEETFSEMTKLSSVKAIGAGETSTCLVDLRNSLLLLIFESKNVNNRLAVEVTEFIESGLASIPIREMEISLYINPSKVRTLIQRGTIERYLSSWFQEGSVKAYMEERKEEEEEGIEEGKEEEIEEGIEEGKEE